MSNCDIYTNWLEQNINKDYYYLAFIFGSIAYEVISPNDCDLLLVTKFKTYSNDWIEMRKENEILKTQFYKIFKLKLSIILLSKDEFNESNSFMEAVLSSKRIIIFDTCNRESNNKLQ